MRLEELVSPKMYQVIQKKRENQKRYKTDAATGAVLPFVFKLTGTGVLDRTVKPPKEMNRDYLFPAVMQIYDRWAKGNKYINIANVTGTESKIVPDQTGQLRHVDYDTTEGIQFINGCLNVPYEREELLCIAMFAHNNLSKPKECKAPDKLLAESDCWYEDNSTLYTGHIVNKANDIKLKATAIGYAKSYSLETQRGVLFQASKDDRFKSLNPDNKTSEAIENDIFVFANDYPREFLNVNVRDETRVELLIHDAVSRNIIVHDVDNAKFLTDVRDKRESLVAYNKVNEDPDKVLRAFMMDKKNDKKRMWIEKLVKPSSHPYMPEEENTVEEATKAA